LPRLSIVIPVTENGIERLEDTLVSVLENRPESCEVIVVHSGCYHDPYELGDEVRFVESAESATLVQLAGLGVAAAHGEIVHLLASGALVEEGWVAPVLAHFGDPDVSSVTPVVLNGLDPARIAAAGVAYGWGGRRVVVGRGRRFHTGYRPPKRLIGPTFAAAFYRASALAAAGGLSDVVGLPFADLDVALTLHLMGYRTAYEPACNVRAAASLITPDMGAWAEGWAAERCFWRHATVQSWMHILVSHPLLVTAEGLANLVRCRGPRALGRLAALCCAARDMHHHGDVMDANRDRLREESLRPGSHDVSRHEPAHPTQAPLPRQNDHHEKPASGRGLRKAG
jgi:hypothetical protein